MKIPSNLKAALERAKSIVEMRRKIEFEIEKAISMQPAAEARLQDALEALGASEADAVLSGQTVRTGNAHNVLRDARENADALAARIAALRRRLAQTDDETIAAFEGIAAPRNEFADKQLADYRASFIAAAEKFSEIVSQGIGLSNGLGVAMLGLHEITLLDPASGTFLEFSPNLINHSAANKVSRAAYESVSPVAEQVREIELIANSITRDRSYREARERMEAHLKTGPAGAMGMGSYKGPSQEEWLAAQSNPPRSVYNDAHHA